MILTFYDKEFKGLQNNASLVVDTATNSFALIKRGVEMDSLNCHAEAFTENIQPVFLVLKDDLGRYEYGALAGIPEITSKNQTKINASDLKSMLVGDVILEFTESQHDYVDEIITHIFNDFKTQIVQNTFTVELEIKADALNIAIGDFTFVPGKAKYDCWTEIKNYLKYYNLYMTTRIDIKNKKIVFTIGKTMLKNVNVKLWEYDDTKNYGKWIASVNETQGYVDNDGTWSPGIKWILTKDNQVTATEANRNIYPVKRKLIVKKTTEIGKVAELLQQANMEALTTLAESLYNEDITIPASKLTNIDFETKFSVYVKRGETLYKELPCGELQYDQAGLKRIKIGYRFTGLEFLR